MKQLQSLLNLYGCYHRGCDAGCGSFPSCNVPLDCTGAWHTVSQVAQTFWAKVAGVAILTWDKDACCALQRVDTPIDPRDACSHAVAVDAVACPAVVDTAYHDIHIHYKSHSDIVGYVAKDRYYLNVGVETGKALAGCINLASGCNSIVGGEQHGVGKIVGFNNIEVDNNQMAHTRQGKVLEHLVAQGSASYYHDVGAGNPFLAELANRHAFFS